MPKINFNNIKFLKSYGLSSQLPTSTYPEISFAGKSNVGKSSLLNKICNNKNLAKVSSTPGKTTTINIFESGHAYLVDLPGYGFAQRSKSEKNRWSELIEGYFNQDRNFALTILLLDIRHDPTKLDCQMIQYVHELGLPFIVCLTKSDKLSKQKAKQRCFEIRKYLNLDERIPMIITSSEKGEGIQDLIKLIEQVII